MNSKQELAGKPELQLSIIQLGIIISVSVIVGATFALTFMCAGGSR